MSQIILFMRTKEQNSKKRNEYFLMIAISKSEKEVISARFPDIHIVRTMKHKSKRHHYYCEENKGVVRVLNKLRGVGDSTTQKVGVENECRKKR